jgi:hypothetical protein
VDSAGTLHTDSASYTLQWYLNGNAIGGATGPVHKATVSGKYWVNAKDNSGCSVNSDTLQVTIIGTEEYGSHFPLEIFPNPSNGIFSIRITGTGVSSLSVSDLSGRILWSVLLNKNQREAEINLSSFPSGIYFLSVAEDERVFYKKIVIGAF